MSKWLTSGVVKELNALKTFRGTSRIIPLEHMKDVQIAGHIHNLKSNGIHPFMDTFVYSLRSKFTFGKFKNNELRSVWKVAPDYVEWCIINADGFVIEPEALKILATQKVIEFDYLNSISIYNGNYATIDLSKLPLNEQGLRVAPEEEEYQLTVNTLVFNDEKLHKECHPLTIIKGSEWSDEKIVIKLPKRFNFTIKG